MATTNPYGLSPTRKPKKSFADLTEDEKWLWYADAYAFEIVFRGADELDVRTPVDPERKHYNARLVNDAVAHKRNALKARQVTKLDERNHAIDLQNARYARAAAWRAAGAKPIPHGTLEPLEKFLRPVSKEFVLAEQELEERREWATLKNYPSWDAYLDAVQAGTESIMAFFDWSLARRPPPVAGFKTLGSIVAPPAPRAPCPEDHTQPPQAEAAE